MKDEDLIQLGANDPAENPEKGVESSLLLELGALVVYDYGIPKRELKEFFKYSRRDIRD